ncbi:pyruvate formate lyase activating enzyme [Azospirillum fermentarium]|uniref:AmmeMemoRadiSam system radical SAM enzyme n=1 Tax=Azospirillum fermentarium TaxID=1233114 RepID=UPI002227F817|nr:AmmeMemoRadiSam system radical SAM enzyme [Azospirillum fermentarium]MCW2247725.1 pyruvate formate lyase activating enzyme [Azospirillum fermentarium]
MQWTPAAFSEPTAGQLRCTLCPHHCKLGPGAVGQCGVRRHGDGGMQTLAHATAVQHLDTVERKPFYHYRPGTRVLTLSAPGCSFRCLYCQNYRLSQYGREPSVPWTAAPVDVAAVLDAATEAKAAIAFSYTEPTLAVELTLALGEAAAERGVAIVWKSNGFITAAAIDAAAPHLAAVNIDIKAAHDRQHEALTGAPLSPVLAAITRFLERGVWVEISTPLIPGLNDTAAAQRQLAALIATYGRDVPWHLVRFVPDFRMQRAKPTPAGVLSQAVDIAHDAGLHHVYVERALGPSARNTFCPGCGVEVVERDVWALRRIRLTDGHCPTCHGVVAGRW